VREPSAALLEAVRRRALPRERDPRDGAQTLADQVVRSGRDTVAAIVFFGSRRTGAQPDAFSAYDFFVLTHGDLAFCRALAAAGKLRRSPHLVAALNLALPPNQLSFSHLDEAGRGLRAKCSVITLGAFLRECSPRRRDHFCVGRLFQPAEILHAHSESVRERVVAALASACAETFSWSRPWLPAAFDTETYCRTLLAVSLGYEVRPEPKGRAEALWRAQADEQAPVYAQLLADLRDAGELADAPPGRLRLTRTVTRRERLGRRAYFTVSLVRATARWAKYVITFEEWLDYLLRKIERQTGHSFELSPRERRWPLIFLWPRMLRFIREKDRTPRAR
jgi:hypothetical protein